MVNLSVKIGKLELNNPVLAASGTFGFGEEFEKIIDLSKLGAVVTKTITLLPRTGNNMPRTQEVSSGLLNSIGLQNEGLDSFIKHKLPLLEAFPTKIIVSIAGESVEEFKKLAGSLDKYNAIDALELNISCPNVRDREKLIAQDPKATFRVVNIVRNTTNKTLITKLSPNVTDIVKIAKAAEDAGSDGLSLINTVYGMSVNLNTRKPHLDSVYGGLSGPAIKPIALYMVYKVARKVSLPIIGIGGIMTAQDALEFMLAGADAIEVGTANFVNPKSTIEIHNGICEYLKKNKIKDIKMLIGKLKT